MKLKLTLVDGALTEDVVVTADNTATVRALVERINHRAALGNPAGRPGFDTLVVNRGSTRERTLAGDETLGEVGLRSGDVISPTRAAGMGSSRPLAVGTLNIVAGPDAPKQFPLHGGTNFVGRSRDVDVRLTDPHVSKRHARLNVSDHVEVIDDGSANGIVIGGSIVDRAVLWPGATATIGDTTFSVTLHAAAAGTADDTGAIAFNRSPRLDPRYPSVELIAPDPPQRPGSQRFPVAALVAPIAMAGMLYAVTKNTMSLLFVAMSPLLMIGAWFENRIANQRAWNAAVSGFRSALLDLSVQLQYAADQERAGRRHEHPSAAEIEEAVRDLAPLVWTRRPEHASFLTFRLGLGTRPSRNTVKLPQTNNTDPALWRELHDVVGRFALIDRVPVVADLREVGNVGVAGPQHVSASLMANVIGQLVATHSPAELVLAGVAGENAAAWDWLKWLPHTTSEFSPLATHHLARTSGEASALVAAIEDVIVKRSEHERRTDERPSLPAVVVFVTDDAPVERARLVQLAERGPKAGVHVVWHAASLSRLPAACRVFVEANPGAGHDRAGFTADGSAVIDLEPERLLPQSADALARRLAPAVDSGTRVDDQSDLPRAVSFLDLAGIELADQSASVIELWRANHALPPDANTPRPKRDHTLRALVGAGSAGPIHLDLRSQGPHALVGGTTGAGKSEFLQSWVLGMAAMHSPSRVTFLFVDYKGGAAFADCVHLPHCVGLVTDLSPHLVRRALTSLNAELHHRERILSTKKAKDLFELEKANDPDAPPSLVIVVDEFAALVHEVPEFVDGVVNVAQRGRSLGLNLILATQRPAGVIKDNLRANTNLRVALRMADEADSDDVVGSKLAATFDPGLPGRGVVKTGPGRLSTFQSAYVGGRTTGEPPRPNIEIGSLTFGAGLVWDAPPEPPRPRDDGPSDIKRVVTTITRAAAEAGVPAPRQPWLPELAPTYKLEELPSRRTDTALVFGVCDQPKLQAQPEIAFAPDADGNFAVYGTGGSGKSAFLRSIAVAAAQATARGGPVHVYGLDFGSRGLQMLEGLPHVGSIIAGDDAERVQRLLRWLRELVNERADRYARANAGTVVEYRARADQPAEARIVVLVDGIGAFRQAYEGTSQNLYWELFQSLAADGRSVGLHFVISADRPGAIPTSLGSAIQRRLVLRLANDLDYAMVDAPSDGFTQTSPPGRGFLDGLEVQVAVLGGVANVARQAEQIRKLAHAGERAGVPRARPIASLAEEVQWSELPSSVGGRPTLGVWDETLEPIGFDPIGTFLVSGPPMSGRTTTVATMMQAVVRFRPSTRLVYLGQRRSPLAAMATWAHQAVGPTEIAALAAELTPIVQAAEPGTYAVAVEGIGELLNTECDMVLQDLIKACRANDQFVVAEGETSSLAGSWPLLQAVKVSRTGIALQPDQVDGDNLFKTSFPRVARANFPYGRGLFVQGGKWFRVQVALPEGG